MYSTPPSSASSSIATSPPQAINFEHYVHYAGKAAELAREAILQLPTLQSRIAQLEEDLQYVSGNLLPFCSSHQLKLTIDG